MASRLNINDFSTVKDNLNFYEVKMSHLRPEQLNEFNHDRIHTARQLTGGKSTRNEMSITQQTDSLIKTCKEQKKNS